MPMFTVFRHGGLIPIIYQPSSIIRRTEIPLFLSGPRQPRDLNE